MKAIQWRRRNVAEYHTSTEYYYIYWHGRRGRKRNTRTGTLLYNHHVLKEYYQQCNACQRQGEVFSASKKTLFNFIRRRKNNILTHCQREGSHVSLCKETLFNVSKSHDYVNPAYQKERKQLITCWETFHCFAWSITASIRLAKYETTEYWITYMY